MEIPQMSTVIQVTRLSMRHSSSINKEIASEGIKSHNDEPHDINRFIIKRIFLMPTKSHNVSAFQFVKHKMRNRPRFVRSFPI